jgi:hypothetical protein
MIAPRRAHLLADAEVAEHNRYPTGYLTVCGELVRASDLRSSSCDPLYCPECVSAAIGWNLRGTGPVDGAPDVVVASSSDGWTAQVREGADR